MKKKSRWNRCSRALLLSGKCLPHPGIFFKARGKGVTDHGLWLHGVFPSGGESWSYRGPSAENETEETRREPVSCERHSLLGTLHARVHSGGLVPASMHTEDSTVRSAKPRHCLGWWDGWH